VYDLETTSRIHDSTSTSSVRVNFTVEVAPFLSSQPHVYGVYRLDDDSEVDFDTLSQDDKDTILDACERRFKDVQEELSRKPQR